MFRLTTRAQIDTGSEAKFFRNFLWSSGPSCDSEKGYAALRSQTRSVERGNGKCRRSAQQRNQKVYRKLRKSSRRTIQLENLQVPTKLSLES